MQIYDIKWHLGSKRNEEIQGEFIKRSSRDSDY